MSLNHKQAQRYGRIGGLTRSANGDVDTSAARAAFNNWEKKVDPEGVLPETERQRRARAERKLFYTRLLAARWSDKHAASRSKSHERRATPGSAAEGALDRNAEGPLDST